MTEVAQVSLEEKLRTMKQDFIDSSGIPVKERKKLLKQLKRVILSREQEIIDAISKDFKSRAVFDSLIAEVYVVVEDIKHTLRHIDEWTEVQHKETSWIYWPARTETRYQPKGVIGIISPWNYPFQLAIAPVVAAIAAGNYFVLKQSECVPNTSAVVKSILSEVFPKRGLLVEDDKETGVQLTQMPLDHLFFTGSTRVGKLVMKSAADNLTPVTLELGGKSPVIIHDTYSLTAAANRIVFGKFVNAGQTCIAPDYILCPKEKVDELQEALQTAIQKSFPSLKDNEDYTAIINEGHLANLKHLIGDAKKKGAKVTAVNPKSETLTHKLEPHIVTNVADDMLMMKEEIFGPILPIVPYTDLEAAFAYVNSRTRPLAMYYFDRNRKRVEAFLQQTISGGVAINDTILQISQVNLPFGGIGASGIGLYHGKAGFESLSHEKSVFRQSRFAVTPFLTRAPYKKFVYSLIRILMRF